MLVAHRSFASSGRCAWCYCTSPLAEDAASCWLRPGSPSRFPCGAPCFCLRLLSDVIDPLALSLINPLVISYCLMPPLCQRCRCWSFRNRNDFLMWFLWSVRFLASLKKEDWLLLSRLIFFELATNVLVKSQQEKPAPSGASLSFHRIWASSGVLLIPEHPQSHSLS